MKKRPSSSASTCPCGSGRTFPQCCGRYHVGEPAPDAEALMRSRYAAYVLGDKAYIRATWHETTRPAHIDLDADGKTRWLGLDVKHHAVTGEGAATVEFVARYKVDGRAFRMHETSRFTRENGRWYYIDGTLHDPQPGT